MKKRIFPIVLLLSIILCVFTACPASDSANSTDKNTDNLTYTDGNSPNTEEMPTDDDDGQSNIYDSEKYDITVRLLTDENATVISKNPLTVKHGEVASFEIVFKDHYKFSGTDFDGAEYKNGFITVSGLEKNTVITATTEYTSATHSFSVNVPDPDYGKIISTAPSGKLTESTRITVTALPAEGQTFIGWSMDETILNGGTVVSYFSEYSFNLDHSITLYPNFLKEGYSIIKYNLNGGQTKDGSEVLFTQFTPINHLCPNLIADNGTFYRDGYTFLEFTENQDGSGEAIPAGGMIEMPKSGILEIYAQWSRWTGADLFEYSVTEKNEVVITLFKGNSDVVSIPERIKGLPVTRIAADAFTDKNFDTLVIPKSVTAIDVGAFRNCTEFNTLYITDSFNSIPDNAFIDCKKFSNLRLNASLPPHNITHAENIGMRLETILTRDESKPLMIFVGGSSCLYGIKAELVEELLDYKYQVINCGTNASGTGILYIEALSHYLKDGDVIINVPEYGANQMGGCEIVWRTFRATESCYNLYRHVDFSKFTGFFSAMSMYNANPVKEADTRYDHPEQSYDHKPSGLKQPYCDLENYKPAQPNNTFNATRVNANSLKDSAIERINELYASLSEKGIKYYFSCAPICHTGAAGTLSTDADIAAFYQRAKSMLTCPVISNPADYTFPAAEYHNSNYHLCTESAIKRTEMVIRDILTQFDIEMGITYPKHEFDVANKSSTYGNVSSTVPYGEVEENTVVTITACPTSGYKFIGWTIGNTYLNGGSIVSYSSAYTFAIKSPIVLYPNYLRENYSLIKYDLNGGKTIDGSEALFVEFVPTNHFCPNLIADNGTIYRDGHTLLEFTENQDGSGEAIPAGGMAKIPSTGILEVYAQWSMWTDPSYFNYVTTSSGIFITNYRGNADVVSIPENINGTVVKGISPSAFTDKNFDTLVIPRTLTSIDGGAFVNCTEFNTLYITDAFVSITDSAFIDCKKFSNLRLNASLPPHNITHAENIGMRLEAILTRDENKPLMIFVGGSSCLYGINAELVEELLDYKYQVINCGTNAGGTGILYIEALSHYLKDGDVIINVPEYGANQMGGCEIVWRTFRATESCYNLFRHVDFSKFTGFFSAMSIYNANPVTDADTRYDKPEQSYNTACTALVKRYCDLVGYKEARPNNAFNATRVNANSLTNNAILRINELYASLSERGIGYYFSCAPICHTGAYGTISSDADIAAFYRKAQTSLDCPVISNPADYTFARVEYYNSNYHLCTDSAIKRTKSVVADILAQLDKEASGT